MVVRRVTVAAVGLLVLTGLVATISVPVQRSDAQSGGPRVDVESAATSTIHVGSDRYPVRLTLSNIRWTEEIRLSVDPPSVFSTGAHCEYGKSESERSWEPRAGDLSASASFATHEVSVATSSEVVIDYDLKVCGHGNAVVEVGAYGASASPLVTDRLLLTVHADASADETERTDHGLGNKHLFATLVHLRRPKPRLPGGAVPNPDDLTGVEFGGENGIIDLVLEAAGDVSSVVPTMNLIGYTRDGATARSLIAPQAFARGGQVRRFPVLDIDDGTDRFYIGITLDAMHLLPDAARSVEFKWDVASLDYDWVYHLGYKILQPEPYLRDVTSMAGKLKLPGSMLLLPDWPQFEVLPVEALVPPGARRIDLAEGVEVCRNAGGAGPRGPVINLEDLTVTPTHLYGSVEVKCFREPIPVSAINYPIAVYLDELGQLHPTVEPSLANLNALGYLHDADLSGVLVATMTRTDGSASSIVVSTTFPAATRAGTPTNLEFAADFDIPIVPNTDVMVQAPGAVPPAPEIVSSRDEYELELRVELSYDLSVPYKTSPGYGTLIPDEWRLPAQTPAIRHAPATTEKTIIACCAGSPLLGQKAIPERWELLGNPAVPPAPRSPAKETFNQEATAVFIIEVEHEPPGSGSAEYGSVISYPHPANSPVAPIPRSSGAPVLPSGNPPPLRPASNVLPGTATTTPSVNITAPSTWPSRGVTREERILLPVSIHGLDPGETYSVAANLSSADSAASLLESCIQPSNVDVASIDNRLSYSTDVTVFSCADGVFNMTVSLEEDSSGSVVASSTMSMMAEVTPAAVAMNAESASVWVGGYSSLKITAQGLRRHATSSVQLVAPGSGEVSFASCLWAAQPTINLGTVIDSVTYEIRFHGCAPGSVQVEAELLADGAVVATAAVTVTVEDVVDVTNCPNLIAGTHTVAGATPTVEYGMLEEDGCYLESLMSIVGRRYADAYTFDLSARRSKLNAEIVVTPDGGSTLDTLVYLLRGATTTVDWTTTILYNDDASVNTLGSRIDTRLDPGVYTVVVTSASNEETGGYSLSATFEAVCVPRVLGVPARVGDPNVVMAGVVPASLADSCVWEDPVSPGSSAPAEAWEFTMQPTSLATSTVALTIATTTATDLDTVVYLQTAGGQALYSGGLPVRLDAGVPTLWTLVPGTTYRLMVVVGPGQTPVSTSTRNYTLTIWRP